MNIIRPLHGETTTALLGRLVGKFLLLNVTIDGKPTSVCVSIKSNRAASWRRKDEDRRFPLKLDSPGFSVTVNTLVLSFDDVNILANNFFVIFEAIPLKAVDANGNVAVGKLQTDGAEIGQLLNALEQRLGDILAIDDSLHLSLDTSLHMLYKEVGHKGTPLMDGDGLSEYGEKLLAAFSESQGTYAKLPQLRGFGRDKRIQHLPTMKYAVLRYYMQHSPTNPLSAAHPLDYVDYELKPLHISKTLNWNCQSNPRTESVDLLLSLRGSPVFTEVKMAGDSFVSSAVVQLMYYACILSSEKQKVRLNREIGGFTSQEGWLCVIAEKRDETKSKNSGFTSDVNVAVSFFRHQETRKVLAPFFCGAVVLVIEKHSEPFCPTKDIPAFRVIKDGEHFVEWNQRQ